MKTNFLELYAVDGYQSIHNPDKIQFNAEVRNIVAFISNFFSYLDKKGFRGIRIDLNGLTALDSVEYPTQDYPKYRACLTYDYKNNFLSKSSLDKKKEILLLLKRAISLICNNTDLDYGQFKEGFEKIESFEYEFIYEWNKPKSFRGSNIMINIVCEIEPGFLNYSFKIENKNQTQNVRFLTLNTYYDITRQFDAKSAILTIGKWFDSEKYIAFGKKGNYERIQYILNISDLNVDIKFELEPDVNEEEFMEEFKMATAETSEEIQKILQNKNFSKWNVYL